LARRTSTGPIPVWIARLIGPLVAEDDLLVESDNLAALLSFDSRTGLIAGGRRPGCRFLACAKCGGGQMYLMYGDEADAEEGRGQKFFLYRGIFIDQSKVWTAHERIEQLRKDGGFAAGDSLGKPDLDRTLASPRADPGNAAATRSFAISTDTNPSVPTPFAIASASS
jgi:hypothetical protein